MYAAASEADVRELHRIYTLTMDRQGASERHYLPYEYFAAIRERLPDNSRILLAEHDGRVVAATLYLHDSADAYSYLGGADHDAQRVRPTNAIVDEMIRWARRRESSDSSSGRVLARRWDLPLRRASRRCELPSRSTGGAHPGGLRRPHRSVARGTQGAAIRPGSSPYRARGRAG